MSLLSLLNLATSGVIYLAIQSYRTQGVYIKRFHLETLQLSSLNQAFQYFRLYRKFLILIRGLGFLQFREGSLIILSFDCRVILMVEFFYTGFPPFSECLGRSVFHDWFKFWKNLSFYTLCSTYSRSKRNMASFNDPYCPRRWLFCFICIPILQKGKLCVFTRTYFWRFKW